MNLTRRELQIADKLLDGATVREIAGEIGISVHTAKTHVKNIYGKLGVSNRVEFVRYRLNG